MKLKIEAGQLLKEYVNYAKNQFGLKVSRIRNDNSTEYLTQDIKRFCREMVIRLDNCTYAQQQNGVSERCMLADSNLEKLFWSKEVFCAVYLLNSTPLSDGRIPAEE